MNKRGLRAFSLGIIFTVSILGTYSFLSNQNQTIISDKASKKQLEKHGYLVLTSADYQKMKKSSTINTADSKAETAKNGNKQKKQGDIKQVITYQLKVTSGMNSDDIEKLLQDHKIIENGNEFGQFLITHQYQTKIQLGTYHLTNKMNYEEISRLITK